MRRVLVGTLLVVSGLTLVPSSRAAEWADRLFADRSHDFGNVPRGAKVRHEFVLNNRLNEPIKIAKVHSSCGCTKGRADAAIVREGRSTVIEAEMDTRNFEGKKSTVVYVSLVTASGREAEVRLSVTSHIVGDILLNPGTIDFGTVMKGQTVSQTLDIERVGMADWRIERMVSNCQAIDGSVVETVRDGKVVGYTLKLALRPDAPIGILRDEVRLKTNDPKAPSIPIQVLAQVRGELTGSPSALTLGKVVSAEGVQGRYLVRSTKPFTVRAVDGTGDGFVVTADNNAAKPMHILTVSYRPEGTKTHGEIHRAFRIHTDLAGEPPLEVTATLHVDPPTALIQP
jgi:hypothetical protein